jgi:hypothetical protein
MCWVMPYSGRLVPPFRGSYFFHFQSRIVALGRNLSRCQRWQLAHNVYLCPPYLQYWSIRRLLCRENCLGFNLEITAALLGLCTSIDLLNRLLFISRIRFDGGITEIWNGKRDLMIWHNSCFQNCLAGLCSLIGIHWTLERKCCLNNIKIILFIYPRKHTLYVKLN